MNIKFAPLVAPVTVALIAATFIRVSLWDSIKMALITALSVAAAAALVRLARGLPFTTASHYRPNEITKITIAVTQIARSLRLFLGITIWTMGLLILVSPLIEFAQHFNSTLVFWGGRFTSGLIGGCLAYVAVRLFQIVNSDLSLLSEQSKFMIRAVEKEHEKDLPPAPSSGPISNFRTPEGYGQRIQ